MIIKTVLKTSIIWIIFILLSVSSQSQILTYSSSNFYFFTGAEIGSYEIKSNTFRVDEFYQYIYEPRKINSMQTRLGFGYNYNRSARFSFGFEFVGALGVPKENTYTYYPEYGTELLTFKAKDKINYIELGYLLDFTILGDLEGTDFTLCISPVLGIQGSRFVSERTEELEGNVSNTGYESLIHLNDENGISKVGIFSAFAKIGPSFQYGISDYWLVYGSAKYAFVYSGDDFDRIKRNNWINIDFGLKVMLN